MGLRKVTVKESASESIAAIAWYIESKGLVATADKFVDDIYDHLIKIADKRKLFSLCREPERSSLGYKCISYKKKYTIVFIESETELIICEFIPSKMIHW